MTGRENFMLKSARFLIATLLMSVLLGQGLAFAKVKIGNVATVAPSGGNYSDPAVAMADFANWCGTPSATNPCLLKIMPGIYDVGSSSVIMRDYVDIEGSGENVTIIIGDISTTGESYQGVLIAASNAEVRFLSIINDATGGVNAVAISSDFQSPRMLHVSATASGGSVNVGVLINHRGSDPQITLTHVNASASGGTFNYGVEYIDSTPTLTNITASASGGTSYGVFDQNDAGGRATIEFSVISGGSSAVHSLNGSQPAYIANTRLEGGVTDTDGAVPKCVWAYDASFNGLDADCQSLVP